MNGASHGRRRGARTRLVAGLRAGRPRLGDLLPPAEDEQVRTIVQYDFRTQPLLRQHASSRGIGKKRLASLHCAGLFEVEVVSTADPEEISAVTGIPSKLSAEVVRSAKKYASEQRTRTIEEQRRVVA